MVALLAMGSAAGIAAPAHSQVAPGWVRAAAKSPAALTPVFSLRRLAGPLHRQVAQRRLVTDLATATAVTGPESLCLDVRTAAGSTLYAQRPQTNLIPASTLKVLVGRALIATLGPFQRLVTEVRGGPAADGEVTDLWLIGGGDPLLSTAEFSAAATTSGRPRAGTSMEALADSVVAAGVRRVGRLSGDDSRHSGPRVLPGWLATYSSQLEITPLSALTVNKGLLFRARPVVAAPDPAIHAAETLAELLAVRGVAVGATGAGVAPLSAALVATAESVPMADVVTDMLTNSDNLASEVLLRELGRAKFGEGTTPAGIAALKAQLADSGHALSGVVVADGSGLDRADRVSCDLLADTLVDDGPEGVVARGLPVAGRSGTLVDRFVATAAEGRVRAKTGSLRGVFGLAGWVDPAEPGNGEALAFAFLANDVSGARGAALTQAVAEILAAHPQAPPLADLSPLGSTTTTAGRSTSRRGAIE